MQPPQLAYALEINSDWAALILSGAKTVELRSWELPEEAVGKRIGLLVPASPGAPGAPALADHARLGPDTPAALAGWAVFGPPFTYSVTDALADEARHRVPAGSPFLSSSNAPLVGWPVVEAGRFSPGRGLPLLPPGRRLVRSLWLLDE